MSIVPAEYVEYEEEAEEVTVTGEIGGEFPDTAEKAQQQGLIWCGGGAIPLWGWMNGRVYQVKQVFIAKLRIW